MLFTNCNTVIHGGVRESQPGYSEVKSRSGVCYLNFCDVKIRHKSENPLHEVTC